MRDRTLRFLAGAFEAVTIIAATVALGLFYLRLFVAPEGPGEHAGSFSSWELAGAPAADTGVSWPGPYFPSEDAP